MKVERKHIKKVTLLKTLKGSDHLTWLPGTVFRPEDGFPADIRDEIGLNRIGVLDIEYDEPQSDSPETPSPKQDVVEEDETTVEVEDVEPLAVIEGPKIGESEPISESHENDPKDSPDEPKTEPRKLTKRVG